MLRNFSDVDMIVNDGDITDIDKEKKKLHDKKYHVTSFT